jgi:hypothetical protein
MRGPRHNGFSGFEMDTRTRGYGPRSEPPQTRSANATGSRRARECRPYAARQTARSSPDGWAMTRSTAQPGVPPVRLEDNGGASVNDVFADAAQYRALGLQVIDTTGRTPQSVADELARTIH